MLIDTNIVCIYEALLSIMPSDLNRHQNFALAFSSQKTDSGKVLCIVLFVQLGYAKHR
jgi:hypothetical protein